MGRATPSLNLIQLIIVGSASLTIAVLHPLVLVFIPTSIENFHNLDTLCLAIFTLDAAHQAFLYTQKVQNNKQRGADRFFIGLDIAVLFPMAWPVFYSTPSIIVLVPLLKLVSINRRLVHSNRQFDLNPMFLRLSLFTVWALVLAHLAACGWISLENESSSITFDQSTYIHALYWAITTLTTVGYGDISPHTDVLKVYTMLVMLVGVGVYGFVVGNIASLFANLDLAQQSFRSRVDNVMAYLKYQNTPKDLQRRAQQYFDYLWDSQVGHRDDRVLEDLPDAMREDVNIHLQRTLVKNVPFFREADDSFIHALIPKLVPQVWVPGQTIFEAGESGTHMYFVSSGVIKIYSAQGAYLNTLRDGDFFGEIALIKPVTRQASVRSHSYCTTSALSRDDLQTLLKHFPDFKEHIESTIESYCI